ncbi:MAG: DUF1810 domain-containing protein [Maribacter sp.]|nr:DUF1810 domain-containing protein [Maribacter sp.]
MGAHYNLDRFINAQEHSYDRALQEIKNGKKTSHWMWYIFPQLEGLGNSEFSKTYAIKNLEEARAYLAHPVLGPRLLEITQALLNLKEPSAQAVFGTPDDKKLRSCMTLFARVAPKDAPFSTVLQRFYMGLPCAYTLDLLKGDTP